MSAGTSSVVLWGPRVIACCTRRTRGWRSSEATGHPVSRCHRTARRCTTRSSVLSSLAAAGSRAGGTAFVSAGRVFYTEFKAPLQGGGRCHANNTTSLRPHRRRHKLRDRQQCRDLRHGRAFEPPRIRMTAVRLPAGVRGGRHHQHGSGHGSGLRPWSLRRASRSADRRRVPGVSGRPWRVPVRTIRRRDAERCKDAHDMSPVTARASELRSRRAPPPRPDPG